ncbi:unnamed protein product, partial [Trichogramma brassicae]
MARSRSLTSTPARPRAHTHTHPSTEGLAITLAAILKHLRLDWSSCAFERHKLLAAWFTLATSRQRNEKQSGPVGEVGGVRLPLQSLHGYGSVFMYSASTSPGGGANVAANTGNTLLTGNGSTVTNSNGEVTLRLREPDDLSDDVLARLEDTATLSISLQGDAVLRLGAATTARLCAETRVTATREKEVVNALKLAKQTDRILLHSKMFQILFSSKISHITRQKQRSASGSHYASTTREFAQNRNFSKEDFMLAFTFTTHQEESSRVRVIIYIYGIYTYDMPRVQVKYAGNPYAGARARLRSIPGSLDLFARNRKLRDTRVQAQVLNVHVELDDRYHNDGAKNDKDRVLPQLSRPIQMMPRAYDASNFGRLGWRNGDDETAILLQEATDRCFWATEDSKRAGIRRRRADAPARRHVDEAQKSAWTHYIRSRVGCTRGWLQVTHQCWLYSRYTYTNVRAFKRRMTRSLVSGTRKVRSTYKRTSLATFRDGDNENQRILQARPKINFQSDEQLLYPWRLVGRSKSNSKTSRGAQLIIYRQVREFCLAGEDTKVSTGDTSKLGIKKPRPKASSPNRQGPQQCQTIDRINTRRYINPYDSRLEDEINRAAETTGADINQREFGYIYKGMRQSIQQCVGTHEAQADAQRREEIRLFNVRQGIQAAGPLSSSSNSSSSSDGSSGGGARGCTGSRRQSAQGQRLSEQERKNGHMLTHRNKKPYECKAEGCGKSYCDARSLRRHTENHHAPNNNNNTAQNNNGSSNNASTPSTTTTDSTCPSSPTTGPNTPNTPGSNPSTPSTPGASAAVTTSNGHGHTALKQLLASEPTGTQLKSSAHRRKIPLDMISHSDSVQSAVVQVSELIHINFLGTSGSGGGSEGSLTKQQLELIQQIMQQQTQKQQQQTPGQQQTQPIVNGLNNNGQQQKSTNVKSIVKSTTNISGPIITTVSGSVAAALNRSSPKPKVWNHAQGCGPEHARYTKRRALVVAMPSAGGPPRSDSET